MVLEMVRFKLQYLEPRRVLPTRHSDWDPGLDYPGVSLQVLLPAEMVGLIGPFLHPALQSEDLFMGNPLTADWGNPTQGSFRTLSESFYEPTLAASEAAAVERAKKLYKELENFHANAGKLVAVGTLGTPLSLDELVKALG